MSATHLLLDFRLNHALKINGRGLSHVELERQTFLSCDQLCVMAYNPDSNDDWWVKLCQGGTEEKKEDEQEPKKKRKRRKRKITSELAEVVETRDP